MIFLDVIELLKANIGTKKYFGEEVVDFEFNEEVYYELRVTHADWDTSVSKNAWENDEICVSGYSIDYNEEIEFYFKDSDVVPKHIPNLMGWNRVYELIDVMINKK